MTSTDGDSRLHEIALGIHAESSLEDTVERVLSAALSALQCSYAALILVGKRGRLELVTATDPVIERLDATQRRLGAGPDIDIVNDRIGVRVDDTRAEERWPAWAEEAAAIGVRSMVGTRLYTTDATVGTLNLYDRRANYFDGDDVAVAQVLARHAAIALTRSRQVGNLWDAIDARKRIGQAQGLLMERYGLREDQAFQVLVRYSQEQNVKLRAVAEELVRSRALPE
ncbi:MAG: GAF and ANTAR domain-containing protein [Marmoricola sp.]